MTYTILAYTICSLILVTVLVSLYIGKNYKNSTSKHFLSITYCTLAFLLLNIVAECLEGNTQLSSLNFTFNLLSFFAVDAIILAFLGYLGTFIKNKKHGINRVLFIAVLLSTIIRIILTIVFAATGNLFAIVDGKYVERGLNSVPYIISAIIMLELIALIIINKKQFSTKQFVVILIYELLPVPAIIVELYTNLYYLTGLALTFSVLLIYLLIQYLTLEENKLKQKVLEEISKTDLLTNMNNRRSYYDKISRIDKNDTIGVLFCDINGLKYENDHFGHASGDKLIKKFASLILESFDNDDSFRISGDEFVIIIKGIKSESFNKRCNAFIETVKNNNYIGAVGYSYGSGDCIDKLISEAEVNMYKDKALHGVKR